MATTIGDSRRASPLPCCPAPAHPAAPRRTAPHAAPPSGTACARPVPFPAFSPDRDAHSQRGDAAILDASPAHQAVGRRRPVRRPAWRPRARWQACAAGQRQGCARGREGGGCQGRRRQDRAQPGAEGAAARGGVHPLAGEGAAAADADHQHGAWGHASGKRCGSGALSGAAGDHAHKQEFHFSPPKSRSASSSQQFQQPEPLLAGSTKAGPKPENPAGRMTKVLVAQMHRSVSPTRPAPTSELTGMPTDFPPPTTERLFGHFQQGAGSQGGGSESGCGKGGGGGGRAGRHEAGVRPLSTCCTGQLVALSQLGGDAAASPCMS